MYRLCDNKGKQEHIEEIVGYIDRVEEEIEEMLTQQERKVKVLAKVQSELHTICTPLRLDKGILSYQNT